MSKTHEVFRILATDFGIKSYLTSEVEVEIRSNRRRGGLVKPALDKSINTKVLKVLTARDLEVLCEDDERGPTLGDIRGLANDLSTFVQCGEAHTFSAGILLGLPVVSNDRNAIAALEANNKALPTPILRSFDLFVFLLMEGYITASEAEQVRKVLLQNAEWIPKCFKNASFADGLAQFDGRLRTSLATTTGGERWSSTLFLTRGGSTNTKNSPAPEADRTDSKS